MEENNNESDIRVKFGKRLAVVRRIRGISQERFAYESGLARSHVSGIERGKINVSLSTIEAISATLRIDPKELFDFDSSGIAETDDRQDVAVGAGGQNKQP